MLCGVIPNYVVANSSATLSTLRLGCKRPTAIVYSGVDLTRYAPTAELISYPGGASGAGAPDASPGVEPARIAIVGRISPWKGQHIFIQAAAVVVRQFPNTRFQIIGSALFSEHDYER